MQIVHKNVWYIITDMQYKVYKVATDQGYDTYFNKENGRVYFTKHKHAKETALQIGLHLEDSICHTTLDFMVL
jgi:hypothetical protein